MHDEAQENNQELKPVDENADFLAHPLHPDNYQHRFNWVAVFEGDDRKQYAKVQGETHYEELDRERLISFQLWEGDRPVFATDFKKGTGDRLIWRRRVRTSGLIEEVCHVIGKRGAFVAAAFESDGRIVVNDNWDENSPWFYKVEPVKGEGSLEE